MITTDSNLGLIISDQIILKIASRCNIACSYCHWFRDDLVNQLPTFFTEEVETATLFRIRQYIEKFQKKTLTLVFHGGEPLLFPKRRFKELCENFLIIGRESKCDFTFALTTNGLLIDKEWCEIFKDFGISPCVSIDGYKEAHNRHRIDFEGKGTHDKVVAGIQCLQQNGFKDVSVLSVYQNGLDAEKFIKYLVDELQVKVFDVLIPNYNHDDINSENSPSISSFYINLFDLWLDKYSNLGVRIRSIESFIATILGRVSSLSGAGLSPMGTVSIRPDGGIEPHDVLRISGREQTETNLNVIHNQIDEVINNPIWKEAYDSSLLLPISCQSCEYKNVCHGGYLIHRFSKQNRYNNPSIYCEDLKKIYQHIWKRVTQTLFVALEQK